jgi:ribose transport system ATP-binding protein
MNGIAENILEMTDIGKRFPGVKALENVDFSIRKGEVHALIGKNGAGKSTLIKILAGIYAPDEGEISFQGKQIKNYDPHSIQMQGVSFIYQDINTIPFLNAAENMFLGQEICHKTLFVDRATMLIEAEKVIKTLGTELDLKIPVGRMSLAQRQLVIIARALIRKPKLVVFDEPTAPLSKSEVDHLFDVIALLKKMGTSVIYISHRLEEIFRIADRVTVIRDGLKIGTEDISKLNVNQLINMMIGEEVGKRLTREEPQLGKEVLRVENLQAGTVFENINFKVSEGEVLGITGLIGAGKTELAEVIFGSRKKSSGELYFYKEKIKKNSPQKAIERKIMLVPEDRKTDGLILDMTVKENLSLGILKTLVKFGIINSSQDFKVAEDIINDLAITTPGPDQVVKHLSGGNQQKVVVGKGLAFNARLFMFDEVTQGVDVHAKGQFLKLIRELAKNGAACIYISNDIQEILEVSDRIIVMYKGRISTELATNDTNEEEILSYSVSEKSEKYHSGKDPE